MFLSSILKKKTSQQQQQDAESPQDSYQEDEPFSAEIYQATEYDASPIETTEQLSEISLKFEGDNSDNVVLVPGLLGFDQIDIPLPGGQQWTWVDYWRDVKDIVEDPIVVSPSSIASLHDRAVQIFYQLKGGQVDYGLAHSQQFCHKQHGEIYEGLMPDWSAENPIVLIGKGYGATTALYLQHLLSTNFFGQNTSGRWVKAIICISAPHRGSMTPYALGLVPGSKTIVHPFSLLQIFLSIVHIICFFTWLDVLFGFQLNDKWSFGGNQSFWSLLCARSGFSYFADNFIVDWSVEGARARYANKDIQRHQLDPNCVYINYITCGQVWKSKESGHYWPRLNWYNWPSALISVILGRYKLPSEVEQRVLRTTSENFWENDGTLAVYSQQPPPHQPIQMTIALSEKLFDPVGHELKPGSWYNVYVEDRQHTVLFDCEPFLVTIPFIVNILDWSYIQCLGEFLSRNADTFEHYYIHSIEFMERYFAYIQYIFMMSMNNQNLASSSKFAMTSSKTYMPNATLERFERPSSDKAGAAWITEIETTTMFNSPSKMIFWMKQMEGTSSRPNVSQGTSATASLSDLKKNDIMNLTNPLTASASFGVGGPMFIKARRKMTAEEYKAVVMNSGSGML